MPTRTMMPNRTTLSSCACPHEEPNAYGTL
jgi:hypothetical protein